MNIEGINLLSSSTNAPVQVGAASLPDNGVAPDSFSNTLTGQVDLLAKASPEKVSPEPANTSSPSLANNTVKSLEGLSQSKGAEDVLSKVLINKLSTSYQQSAATPAPVVGKNADLQSKLQALTDGIKSTLGNTAPDALTIAQNISAAMATPVKVTASAQPATSLPLNSASTATIPETKTANVQTAISTQSDKTATSLPLNNASTATASAIMPEAITAKIQVASRHQSDKAVTSSTLKDTSTDTLSAIMPEVMAANAQIISGAQTDKASTTDTPTATTSDIMPDTMAIAQNMSAVMAINAQVAPTIQSDKPAAITDTQAKVVSLPPSDVTVIASDALPKETATNQSDQHGPASDLPTFDDLLSAEKTLAVKDLLTTSDTGSVATGVSRDIAGTQQPVMTNKIDSPVLTKPLTHPEWSKDLGNQIIWMNNKELSTAEIRMNPEHLGPISIRIDLTQDQASVQFTAQHAVVREALEASIPKLREMLGTQQLNLADVTVSQSTTSDQGQSQSPYQSFSRTPDGQAQGVDGVVTGLSEEAAASGVVVNKGLLSIYA
jgi:flagellar hook-length control protein FliK